MREEFCVHTKKAWPVRMIFFLLSLLLLKLLLNSCRAWVCRSWAWNPGCWAAVAAAGPGLAAPSWRSSVTSPTPGGTSLLKYQVQQPIKHEDMRKTHMLKVSLNVFYPSTLPAWWKRRLEWWAAANYNIRTWQEGMKVISQKVARSFTK